MKKKKIFKIAMGFASVAMLSIGCTKLHEDLGSTFTNSQVTSALGSAGTALLLNAAYNDLANPLTSQERVFSLEETAADEALVPTRGGDWDDNGVWRVMHAHTWNADHIQLLNTFNELNKINFDATNVLAFNPTTPQAAEARFLRALSLYYLLDLYGQYAIRQPGEDLRKAPAVKSGAEAINFIISELAAVLPSIPTDNPSSRATPEACRTLLMKCYLQKASFINRASPAFSNSDLDSVRILGTAVINSGKYRLMPDSLYFKNFSFDNNSSTEGIFVYPNTTNVTVNNSNIHARWNMTLHYNSYSALSPNAGWNGFTTISDFYNAFNTTSASTTYSRADTIFDKRLGGRIKSDSLATAMSGIRPGFLVGQQYNQNGVALNDRKGNALAYTTAISSNMIESGNNLEITGIRVVKYVPDFTASTPSVSYGSAAGNDLMIFRYADVYLMVAEAQARLGNNSTALSMVNTLRASRGAAPLASMILVDPNNVENPQTLLAERGRELYWESVRRTDLIRFGVFLKLWQYKTADDPKNLVYPIPSQALAANPNLKQNTGY